MKLEIDIPSIIYQDAKENGNYISVTKLEIAWKAIADGKPLEQEPTTKNNLGADCQYTDEEIAKSFIEDVEAVKDQLPTTKNDLGVDCIDRADALDCVNWGYSFSDIYKKINELPAVTPQPRKGHWINKQHLLSSCSAECSSCQKRSNGYVFDNGFSLESEYYDFCPNCGAKMESEEKND